MADMSSPPLPRGTVSLYYAVQFGKTLLWVAADLIAYYVLATVERLSMDDVALVLMGGLAWHALSDAVVGQWLERYARDGRRLADVTAIAVPIASLTFVSSLLVAARAPWLALVLMMVSRSAYSLFDVPHQALIARMARRGLPAVRIIGVRNVWGQAASLALGLGLAPALDPDMTPIGIGLVLAGIGAVATILSMPVGLLIRRLWDVPDLLPATAVRPMATKPVIAVTAVLGAHFLTTIAVTTASKLTLSAAAPGIALAVQSAGRVVASLPRPIRWRERHAGAKLAGCLLLLTAAIAALMIRPGLPTLFLFGLAGGWANILTWAWLAYATDHPRPFAIATMLTKAGLLLSVLFALHA